MQILHVAVGINSQQQIVVLGDEKGRPFQSERAAEKACVHAGDDFPEYRFIAVNVQGGPRRT